jgi:hypothetical protein
MEVSEGSPKPFEYFFAFSSSQQAAENQAHQAASSKTLTNPVA